jgi:phosphoribosyl-ATP pyrophosphohydrolase
MTEVAKEGKKRSKVSPELGEEGSEGIEAARSGAQASGGRKLRLSLVEDESSALFHFQNALKDRGIKNLELSDIIVEALATVPQEWWDAKLEELTPLEWKLHAALGNPEMRAKLLSLLEGKKV